MKDNQEYDDEEMIRLPHPVSKRHPQMPLLNRAAQFAPFAALTGHAAAVQETARLTEPFIELDESEKIQLDEKLRLIRENIRQKPEIEVTYFQPDEKKEGGAYITFCGRVKKIDEYHGQLIFLDGKALPTENILSLRGELLGDFR